MDDGASSGEQPHIVSRVRWNSPKSESDVRWKRDREIQRTKRKSIPCGWGQSRARRLCTTASDRDVFWRQSGWRRVCDLLSVERHDSFDRDERRWNALSRWHPNRRRGPSSKSLQTDTSKSANLSVEAPGLALYGLGTARRPTTVCDFSRSRLGNYGTVPVTIRHFGERAPTNRSACRVALQQHTFDRDSSLDTGLKHRRCSAASACWRRRPRANTASRLSENSFVRDSTFGVVRVGETGVFGFVTMESVLY